MQNIAFVAVSGLSFYLPNIKILTRTIRSDNFVSKLYFENRDEHEKTLKELIPFGRKATEDGAVRTIGKEEFEKYKKSLGPK